MNDAEYKALVQSAYEGKILIGVDRIFARKVYMEVPAEVIYLLTGESPYFEKFVVWSAFLASPLAICASAIVAGFAFGWWALLVVPVAIVWWIVNRSISTLGRSSMGLVTLFLVTAVSLHFAKVLSNPWKSGFLVLFAIALWSDRLLYCASTTFLRAFVLRNKRAFEAFSDGLVVRESGV